MIDTPYQREIDHSWNFKTANTKEFTHCYHAYPAMMIPQIARKLLKEYAPSGRLKYVLDPYMGSGTTLVECSLLGIKSLGIDINPLARLIGNSKIDHHNIEEINILLGEAKKLSSSFKSSWETSLNLESVTNIEFWYHPEVVQQLAFITEWVYSLDIDKQNFFKVALSEVIRESSYTRNSEFKRYRIAKEKLEGFSVDPFELFLKKIERNLNGLSDFVKNSQPNLAKVESFNTVDGFPEKYKDNCFDMVVTSPPYGDSRTTVAYGQFSRFASEWLGYAQAQKVDNMLMGGTRNNSLKVFSESIKKELLKIGDIDPKRLVDVLSFLDEYKKSIFNVASKVRSEGIICYVVGNRTVKGVQIPLDYFTAEIFELAGAEHINTLVREIPNKKMPSLNSPTNVTGKKTATMTNEYIVIMRKK